MNQQLSFTKALSFPSSGFYDVTVTASNEFDSVSVELTVKMVYDFPASIAMTTGLVVDKDVGNYPIEFTRDANDHSPTNASCTIYKDDTIEGQFDLDLGSDHTQPANFSCKWIVGGHDLGPFDYSVNCSTCNQNKSWTGTVFLQKLITNLQVSIDNGVATPGQNVCVTLEVDEGSHITFIANFGDNCILIKYDEAARRAELCHPYETDDNHTIEVKASNQLVNLTDSVDVIVQYPVTALQLDVRGGQTTIAIPSGENKNLTFDLRIADGPTEGPTNAFCSWKAHESAEEDVMFATDLRNLQNISNEFTYSTTDPIGNQRVNVTCSNLVSSMSAHIDLILQIPCTSAELKSSRNPVGIDKNITYTVLLQPDSPKCSHVSVFYDFGDGNTEVQFYDGIFMSDPHITYAYSMEDTYSPSIEVWNQVTSPNLTDSLSEDVIVLKSLIYGDFSFNYTTPQQWPANVALNVNTTFPYTDTTVTFIWGINDEKTVVSNTEWPVERNFTYDKGNDVIGNVTLAVRAENNVSNIEWNGTLVIKQAPSEAMIILDNYYKTDEDITGQITLTQGSHLNLEVTCLAVDGATGCSESYTDSSDNTSISSWSFPLSFPKSGQYNVEVNVSNEFGHITARKMVTILKPLTYEDFTFTYTTPQQWPANVALSINTTFPYRETNVTFNWGINDEDTVVSNTEWPVKQNFTYAGENNVIGNITLTVRAENRYSNIEWNGTLVIKQPPSGAMIILEDYYGTEKDITGQITLDQGSHLKLEVTCLAVDGATGCSKSYTDSSDNTSISSWSFPLNFPQPGQYNIEVNVSNEFGHSTARKMVTILKSLIFEDFTFTYTTPQQWPANVALNINTTFPYRETNVTFNWGINDEETMVSDTEWPVERNFTYDKGNDVIGNVTLTVRAENRYSNIEWNGILTVKQAPSGAIINLEDYYRTNEDITGQITLTQGSHLKLEVTCLAVDGATGCSESYTDSSDNTSIPSWSFPLDFTKPGRYNVEVNVSNEFGYSSANKLVTIQNPIEGFTIRSNDDPNHVSGDVYTIPFMGRNTDFTMLLEVTNDCASPPTDAIMERFVDFPRDVENVTERNTSVVFNCSSLPFEVKRTYGEIGDYVIKVNVFNQISSAAYTLYVKVLEPLDDDFNITVEPQVEPDADGLPSYPIRHKVNITAAHGAIADYTHTFYLSYNCDDNKNPLDGYSENCNQETEYASGQDVFVNDVLLRYSGIYRMTIKVTYPGIESIYSTKKIRVRRVPEFRLRVDKKNPDNSWSELSQPLAVYNLQDIKHLDLRFTSLHNEVTIGSWTIRWFIDGKEVSGSPTVDAPFEANGETYFAAPGDYSIQAKLDALPDVDTPHDQLFESSIIGLTVDSSVGICDVQVPASGFLNEKFKPSDSFACSLTDPQFCLVIFKMCEPLQETGTCFSVTIADPDNLVRYHQNYGSIVGACGTDNDAIFIDRKVIYDDIQWPSNFDFNAIGQWKMIVETSVTFKDNKGEDITKSERSDKIVEVRCRPCNRPRVMLVNPQGEGSSINNTRKYSRYVFGMDVEQIGRTFEIQKQMAKRELRKRNLYSFLPKQILNEIYGHLLLNAITIYVINLYRSRRAEVTADLLDVMIDCDALRTATQKTGQTFR